MVAAVDDARTRKYKRTLDHLMSFLHGLHSTQSYGVDRRYTVEELYAITPSEVVRWMKFRTYGTPDPDVAANPLYARSNSLKFWKKSISFFMPNRLMPWSEARQEGNPTRSTLVNDLIKQVKRKEARKQGAVSRTRRPMKASEFTLMHSVLKENVGSDIWRYGMRALVNFQFHLIARIDDATQVVLEHIRVHDSFPNALKTRLNWSKNVEDERDAPWQIVLGAMDPLYCVLCSLGDWCIV